MGICSSSSHVAVVSQNIQKSKQQPITHPNDNKNNKSDDHDDHILVPAHHKDKFGHEVDNNTGGRVFSEEYYKARNEASEQAKLRGQCFEKSKHAYTSGQKADAKHLSDEGTYI